MTTQQAKQILLAYRPWLQTDDDLEMREALALCRTDAELGKWFAEHCAWQTTLRAKFQGVTPPPGLQQQIVSEHRASLVATKWRRRLMAATACLVMGVSVFFIAQSYWMHPKEDLSFNGYRNRMARTALRAYGMDLETNNLSIIQAHLRNRQAPVDYSVPAALQQTPVVGCGVLSWQGKPVTMVCYRTDKALPPGMKSDLILFVIDEQNIQRGAVLPESREVRKVSEWITASWRSGDKIYLLAAFDEAELRERL